ncbi:MAG: methionyl aminopeptidase [Bacillota bacterium]
MKIGRNDPCWCKSGKKYKVCHYNLDEKLSKMKAMNYEVPPRNIIKTAEQIEGIRQAGIINTKVLDMVSATIKEGMSTDDINTLVHKFTFDHHAIPAPLGYNGFPKSVCTSLNQVVCHGIPCKEDILISGDIINVDVTTIYNGYYADASRMFCIGTVTEEAQRLVDETKKALDLAVAEVRPFAFLGNIGAVIGNHAKKCGYSVVKDIGGHGVGLEFHEDPYVCHVGEFGTGMVLVPGMVFTIEPMINMGKEPFFQDAKNGWTIYTKDGKLSAQWEYTVLVTEDGFEILAW